MEVLHQQTEFHKILVVEALPSEQTFLQQCFNACGHRCCLTFAVTIEEAYSHLQCSNYKFVVLDLYLGREDGLELVELMRAEPCLAYIPVVALSARRGQTVRAYTAGINVLVEKSPDPGEYRERIKSILDFWFRVATLPEML